MGFQGTEVLDFGPTPSDYAYIEHSLGADTVGMSGSSKVEAFFMGSTTVDSDEEDHLMAAVNVEIICEVIVDYPGFRIHAFTTHGLTKGQYNIQWSWV